MAADARAITFAVALKKRMMNMPDDLDTKKDVDEYFKNLMKDIKEEMKNDKIQNAEKKKNDKKKKRDNLDEDGNVKPKKPLNKYQQFIKDNQERIKQEFPDLSNTERFTKLAEEWNKFKATLVDNAAPSDEDNAAPSDEDNAAPSDEGGEEPSDEGVEEPSDEEKEKKPKKTKKPSKKAV